MKPLGGLPVDGPLLIGAISFALKVDAEEAGDALHWQVGELKS